MINRGLCWNSGRVREILLIAVMSLYAVQSSANVPLDDQRALFREAVTDAREGRVNEATAAITALGDYPLVPYLQLELFKAKLFALSHDEAKAQLNEHANSIVGSYMERAWVTRLVRNRNWEAFLQFTGSTPPGGLQCEYITALRATGRDADADRFTRKLWNTGYSLPERCDTVLANWLYRLSTEQKETVHWTRARLALQQGQSGLAEYLLRDIQKAELARDILTKPDLLYQKGHVLEVNDFNRLLVIHTLQRLAAKDFQASNTLWHQLNLRFQFTAKENYALRDRFAREIIAGGADFARNWLDANDRQFEDHYLTEWRVRLALKDRDWEAVQRYIAALPENVRDKADWKYWWARADIEQHQRMTPQAKAVLNALASERGYYSFLSADLLRKKYQLGGERTVNTKLIPEVENLPGMLRARELHWHGFVANADTEWRRAVRSLSQEQQVAAAQMALDWGWSNAAVLTALRAKEWDDLELRFPLAFQETFEQSASNAGIELNWAYAIARQESAFAEHAQSRVGARGVMQLMPSTARGVARDMGRAYPTLGDLHTPAINIEMGTYYLGQLRKEFGGNHILATAAYNAGPQRIKRVLERQTEVIPADIWIENLPYGETREYIKNVLAFSVVYGLKLKGCKSPSVQTGCNAYGDGRYAVIAPNLYVADKDANTDGARRAEDL